MKQLTVIFLGAALVAACGGGARPAPQSVANTAGEPAAPSAEAPLVFDLDGAPWTLTAAGATVERDGEYGQKVIGSGYELALMPWPDSDAFVQTLPEHLAGLQEKGPIEVLHQLDNGRGNFEAVVRTGGKIDVTVLLRPVPGLDGAICGASLADGTDWHAAHEACRTLAPDTEHEVYDNAPDEE